MNALKFVRHYWILSIVNGHMKGYEHVMNKCFCLKSKEIINNQIKLTCGTKSAIYWAHHWPKPNVWLHSAWERYCSLFSIKLPFKERKNILGKKILKRPHLNWYGGIHKRRTPATGGEKGFAKSVLKVYKDYGGFSNYGRTLFWRRARIRFFFRSNKGSLSDKVYFV